MGGVTTKNASVATTCANLWDIAIAGPPEFPPRGGHFLVGRYRKKSEFFGRSSALAVRDLRINEYTASDSGRVLINPFSVMKGGARTALVESVAQ